MSDDIAATYLSDVREQFAAYKKLGERAIAQVYDSGLNKTLGPEGNSIAILVKHLAGNMRSRWTGFLTTDGEKPDRNRDGEFEDTEVSRAEILQCWEDGWACLFDALDGLHTSDLMKTVMIRGHPLLVVPAINRQLAHYAYHVGQIVFLARHFAGASWTSLSIPRRASQAGPPGS